jgi:hypothetical protein
VTDTCGDETTVLLNESVSEARWDISSTLDVTLTTREAGFREKRFGWSLVDYLFSANRGRVWNGTGSEEAALGRLRRAGAVTGS